MRFNFEHSIPVNAIRALPDNYYEIRLAFRSCPLCVKSSSVRFVTDSKNLHDSSLIVADLGSKGYDTEKVIVAAENIDRFKDFFYWNNTPLPEEICT